MHELQGQITNSEFRGDDVLALKITAMIFNSRVDVNLQPSHKMKIIQCLIF